MKPIVHARISVRRHGGSVEDYLPIHDFLDSTKAACPDIRHRAILHNAFGCFLVEKVFGHTLTNSIGRVISTRDIAEDHILEDCGRIPSIEDWVKKIPLEPWMSGGVTRSRDLGNQEMADVPLPEAEDPAHALKDLDPTIFPDFEPMARPKFLVD